MIFHPKGRKSIQHYQLPLQNSCKKAKEQQLNMKDLKLILL